MYLPVLIYLTIAANGMFPVEIKISAKDTEPYLNGRTIQNLRQLLSTKLRIKPHNVRFETAAKGCIIIVFL